MNNDDLHELLQRAVCDLMRPGVDSVSVIHQRTFVIFDACKVSDEDLILVTNENGTVVLKIYNHFGSLEQDSSS